MKKNKKQHLLLVVLLVLVIGVVCGGITDNFGSAHQ